MIDLTLLLYLIVGLLLSYMLEHKIPDLFVEFDTRKSMYTKQVAVITIAWPVCLLVLLGVWAMQRWLQPRTMPIADPTPVHARDMQPARLRGDHTG